MHLDDYVSVIETTVARPIVVTTQPPEEILSSPAPLSAAERWPPKRVPLTFWGVKQRPPLMMMIPGTGSIFALHCQWLIEHLPVGYALASAFPPRTALPGTVQDYWQRHHGSLPALGHLHVLYDHQGLHASCGGRSIHMQRPAATERGGTR